MKRELVLARAGWLLAVGMLLGPVWAAPALAAVYSGGVEMAYEYFDPDQALADDAQARLRQTYLLNAAGDIWAPEVASYRSALRYDAMTQSWEYPGGAFNNGVRSLTLETRLFPMSPLGFTLGGGVRSSRDDLSTTGTSTGAVDEVNLYGRMWFSPAQKPSTSVQFSHNSLEGRRFDYGVETLTQSSSGDTLSVSTTFRYPKTQVGVSVLAGQSTDDVVSSETFTQAARVQFSSSPRPAMNIRTSVDVSGVKTEKPLATTSSQNQSAALRVSYQLRQNESLQFALSGGHTQQALTAGEREDTSRSVSAYYARPLGPRFRGLLMADYSQADGLLPGGGQAVTVGRTSLRGEVASQGLERAVWTGALTLDSVRESDLASPGVTVQKPGATLENRLEYRLLPRLTVGAGAALYKASVDAALAGVEVGRTSLQTSMRWSGGRTGQASLGVLAAARDYADGADSRETRLTVSAGVSPRDDLDFQADIQASRTEMPSELGIPWQNSVSATAGVVFRPRSDWNVTGSLSYQQSETSLGPKHQTSIQVRTEYLFYALKVGGLLKLGEIQELGTVPRRSSTISFYAKRDF